MAVTTRKAKDRAEAASGREVLKLTSKLVRKAVAERLPSPPHALEALVERSDSNGRIPFADRLRRVPIQCSIDVGAPLELVYEEWMQLEFLPEGVHTIVDIERDGEDYLVGRIKGARGRGDWEAEVRDERCCEAFAWRSVVGSDCAGLITFHRLSERLTRLELELDVVPVRAAEAFELVAHIADRRAEADLRRFKARLETISPDDYPPLGDQVEEDTQANNDEED
jgi:hypothetical protein